MLPERLARILEQFFYTPGNPFVYEFVTGTAVDTDTQIDLNNALGRNAHRGFIKSASVNGATSIITIAWSHNGQNWSKTFEDLRPGESIALDGMDIHSLRIKSNISNDQVHIVAW